MTQDFVAYYRVSTDRQGQTGLGLEAQRTRVADHVARCGGQVVGEFSETPGALMRCDPHMTKGPALF